MFQPIDFTNDHLTINNVRFSVTNKKKVIKKHNYLEKPLVQFSPTQLRERDRQSGDVELLLTSWKSLIEQIVVI